GDFVARISKPDGSSTYPVMLLLHGLTGNEDAMWVFTRKLSEQFILISPRGLFNSPYGGYSWNSNNLQTWPSVDDFSAAIEKIMDTINPGFIENGDYSKLYLIGFSQGAALTYTLALTYPERVVSFAGLSGFLPEDEEPLLINKPLTGISGYIAHGIKDTLVPVEKARHSVKRLKEAGAEVVYCEKDTGHKLSAPCFRDMESFFLKQVLNS
ncbi:MAG: alpha/beta fold hydrolase, partial [Anaerolineales bacterium]|nr:alpha/beta fold hydrolase [Anaerolineales bacterium]